MAEKIVFEWDPRKSESNRRKHGDDAELVFRDPLRTLEPEGHEHGEIRWRTVGEIAGRLYFVVHTIREDEEIEIYRIISARRATRRERKGFEEAS